MANPGGFFYLDRRTTDEKLNLITDVYVTPGNVYDSVPYLERLDRQIERFGFNVENVALDSGYLTNHICHGLRKRGIFDVIDHRRFRPKKGLFHKWQYKYCHKKMFIFVPIIMNLPIEQQIVKVIVNIILTLRCGEIVSFYQNALNQRRISKP